MNMLKIGRMFLAVIAIATIVSLGQTAAPIKTQPASGPVDFSAVHKLIANANAGTDFPEGDLNKVKEALTQLLARLDALEKPHSGMTKNRKLPIPFNRFRTAEVVEKVSIVQQAKSIFVGKEGRIIQSSLSVMLVSGDAELIQSENCVVVAGGHVKMSQSSNCIVVAGRSVKMSQCFPKIKGLNQAPENDRIPEPVGSVVVAGEWLECLQSQVAITYVLRPDRTKGTTPIQSSQCRDIVFLNALNDWKSNQDTNCRADPLTSPLAK
jgi:hypothetical protein